MNREPHLLQEGGDQVLQLTGAQLLKDGDAMLFGGPPLSCLCAEDLTHEPVHLTDYLNRKYRFGLTGRSGLSEILLSSIAVRQYTSMADLNLAVRLVRLREAAGSGGPRRRSALQPTARAHHNGHRVFQTYGDCSSHSSELEGATREAGQVPTSPLLIQGVV